MGACMSMSPQENKNPHVKQETVCYMCSKRIYQTKYLHCRYCSRCAHIKCLHQRGTDMITCDSCRKRDSLSLVVP